MAVQRAAMGSPGNAGQVQGRAANEGTAVRLRAVALLALLVVAFSVRLWLAWPEPHAGRWWDERFNIRNIQHMLRHDTLEPANFYYGGLSYQPQAALVWAVDSFSELTGVRSLNVVDAEGRLVGGGYRLLRGTQVLYGTFLLLGTFLVGRRMFCGDVGLLAAAIVAASPRHVHSSAIFKPDILLALLSLIAFWWILDVIDRPSTARYMRAGLGIGLATAAKLNGATMALPLVLLSLLHPLELKRWLRLTLAGLASVLVFLSFNPWPAEVLRFLRMNQAHYDLLHPTGGPLDVGREIVGYLFAPEFHGPWVGTLAAFGLGALAVLGWRGQRLEGRRLSWLVLASYPITYFALYLVATRRAKENHFLQVVPFTSLAAGWLALTVIQRLLHHLPRPKRKPALAAMIAGATLALTVPPLRYVYERVLPSTDQLAVQWLEQRLGEPRAARIVLYERDLSQVHTRGGRGPVFYGVDRLSDLPEELLESSDAELFAGRRLRSDQGGAYLRRVQQTTESRRFETAWFESWGGTVVALVHPWEPSSDGVGQEVELRADGPGEWQGLLETPIDAGQTVSFHLRLPRGVAAVTAANLSVGGHRLPLNTGRRIHRRVGLFTRRWSPAAAAAEIRLELAPEVVPGESRELLLVLYHWSRPSGDQ